MQCFTIVVLVSLVCSARCMPVETEHSDVEQKDVQPQSHSLWKRFVNPMFAVGGLGDSGINRMRTKRQAEGDEECEKLALCKLHARSHRSFFAAFELYFVNKENAQEWDHHSRTLADCEQRFGDCYQK